MRIYRLTGEKTVRVWERIEAADEAEAVLAYLDRHGELPIEIERGEEDDEPPERDGSERP